MATKSGRPNESVYFRATRRSRKLLPECQQVKEEARCVSSQESVDNHNQISPHHQQQQKLKVEKETASPLNNDLPPPTTTHSKVRRNTRSSSHLPNKQHAELDAQLQQYTPEDNILQKIEEQPTSKKLIKVRSSAELSEELIHDKNLTLKKVISRQPETIVSPYCQFRKSYRKQHKREIISLPYRKCHDILEGRIVTIINKIESGKNCLRDFQSLIEKMHKISPKDLMNRFIVGGIKTIIAIALEKNIYDPKIIFKLQQESKRLQERIIEELDSIREYEGQHEVKIKGEENMNRALYRSMYMKKMYKILRKKQPLLCRDEVKEKIVNECDKLFEGEINLSFLVRCLRNKLEL